MYPRESLKTNYNVYYVFVFRLSLSGK